MKNFVSVGIGEIVVSKNPQEVLVSYGLGSCVALCLYDPLFKIGGMAHIMLPDSRVSGEKNHNFGKFADTAVPYLIEKMREKGAIKFSLRAKIFGGSRMMFNNSNISDWLDIGSKNVIAVKSALKREGINLEEENVGGNLARTVLFFIEDGNVIVKNGLLKK
jgi:chemotaxis protein CheD